MEFLFTNYPPMKTDCKTFVDTFYGLIPETDKLDIAVGYVSADSLIEIQKIIELNKNIHKFNLVVGMHYFDKFTRVQYNAAMHLNDFLTENHLGEVRLVTAFRYHGKLYSYSNENGPFAGIIGSNNLSSIVDGGARVYESSVLLNDYASAKTMNDFISSLVHTSTRNIAEVDIQDFNEDNAVLGGNDFVKRMSIYEMALAMQNKTDISFDIPIKTYEVSPQSNLNVFFGKGRVSKNGVVKPRHWYEVELIVPKTIACQPGYPQSKTDDAEFDVVTDDGWSFRCKVSGDYSKNFRSEGDLKILGKWLKGRLENAGALKVGEPVTAETLRKYGRNTFTLTKTKTDGTWFLDFEVKK
ncbi:MAG: NgoFVII family restriction endonuclease [Lachnospiraceae bacterium]|nr:NgoFVII family restriction endonuclease [Lachnospiraceae bacterium]